MTVIVTMTTDNGINPQDLKKRRVRLGIPLSVIGEYMGFSGNFIAQMERGAEPKNRLRAYALVLDQCERGKITLRSSPKVLPRSGSEGYVTAKAVNACRLMRCALDIPADDAADALGCAGYEITQMELGERPMSYAQLASLLKMMAREAEVQGGLPLTAI